MRSADDNRRLVVKVPIPIQDIYDASEAAEMLGVGKSTLAKLYRREDDPLPMRRLPTQSRGMVILREELLEWIRRNYVLVSELSYKRLE